MRLTLLSLLLCCLFLLTSNSTQAQQGPYFTNGFSAKYIATDYLSPLKGEFVEWFEDLTPGGELAYYRGLNNNFNLAIPLRFGKIARPLDRNRLGTARDFLSLDATIQFQPFGNDAVLSPYALLGIGAVLDHTNEINAQLPLGAGLNVRIGNYSFLQVQSEYRTEFAELGDNFVHSAGLMIIIGGKLVEKPIELPPVDTDGDGITDAEDKCPKIAGLAAFSGCPDTDSDGITDAEDDCPDVAGMPEFAGCPDTDGDGLSDNKDACPEQAGTLENKGCPVADADGDGIPDDKDICPNEKGPATTGGCPDGDGDGVIDRDDPCPGVFGKLNGCPDSDGDGLADGNDRCPNTAGPIDNKGCPIVKEEVQETLDFVAQNVRFETGKATLKAVSSSVLDQVYEIMIQYPNYSIAIGGHTDSIGSADTNQLLSERRAKSCYDYLINKGIASSRMSYTGYGETRPIAENKYKAGRKQNRRVEFNLFLK